MAATAEETSWQEKLSQVEGVISVEAIPLDASAQFFEEKYLVTFEQPLDWSDPDAGSFPQRVEIHYCLDVSFNEDHSRIRKDHAPDNLAVVRHLALYALKQLPEPKRASIKRKRKI